MTILDADIKWRKSTLISSATPAQNGGRMTFAEAPTQVRNALLPDFTPAERVAGAVKWRKAFIHAASAGDETLFSARPYLAEKSPGDVFSLIYPGTMTDTQDAVTSRGYGVGSLSANVTAGATSAVLVVENIAAYTSLQPFRVGDAVRFADGTNEEWVTLSSVAYGANVTIGFTTTPLAAGYATAATVVSAAFPSVDIAPAVTGVSKTSTAGTLVSQSTNIKAHNKGSGHEIWTLTFTSPTAFSVSGDVTGAIAGGSTAVDYAPINPATGTPFFTVKSALFGGTWAPGDTLTFTTVPAAIPVWYRIEAPAGAASAANTYASVAVYGEST